MGTTGQLKGVEDQLIKGLRETTLPYRKLGEKYGVSRQAIFAFMHRKGIKRPKREHIENCSICQRLIRIGKKPHSDFISSRTIKEKLRIGTQEWVYHVRILREKGLIPQKFGRLQSQKLERAYQIYFKRRLPVNVIGKQVGHKNFRSALQRHKASGWDVPDPLFAYDGNARRKTSLKVRKRKGRQRCDILKRGISRNVEGSKAGDEETTEET